jgi:hypothetical protein
MLLPPSRASKEDAVSDTRSCFLACQLYPTLPPLNVRPGISSLPPSHERQASEIIRLNRS